MFFSNQMYQSVQLLLLSQGFLLRWMNPWIFDVFRTDKELYGESDLNSDSLIRTCQRREKYFYLFSCETECGHHLHSVLLVKTGIPMCMCVGFVDLKWFTQQVLKIKACGLPLPIHIVVATLIARLLTWVATQVCLELNNLLCSSCCNLLFVFFCLNAVLDSQTDNFWIKIFDSEIVFGYE